MSIARKSAVAGLAAALAVASFVSPAFADRWHNNRDAKIAAGAAAGFAAGSIVGAAASQPGYYAPRGVYVAPRGAYVAPAPRVYYRPPAYRSNCGVRKVKAWDPVQRRNVTVQKTVVCR